MVSNKSNKKAKKPVETTLGKAPSKPKEKDSDLSHMRKPIETSICGMKQVLSLLENATNEVKNFVMYECDIMYECRICRSIFRSLANFILHKRNYCREKINPLDYINNNHAYQENVYMSEENQPSAEGNKSLNKVIEKLQKMDHVREVAKNVLTQELSSDSSNQKLRGMDDIEEKSSNFNSIVLEKINSNNSGVFQTLVGSDCSGTNPIEDKSTKLEVMEIHKIIENDVPVLDPEGKICGFTSNKMHHSSIFPKSEFNCIECNHRFASQKSLTNHIKCVHNPSRIIYVCPTCKDTFANPWCVYRHLLKVHRMTNKQVRRMREQVHNSWIRRGEESSIQKRKPLEMNQGEADSEHQWINDIEGDNDFQMCAGCGKHFERKAALHSHSQMCAKRLEVCNSIKENAKKKEAEEANEKTKLENTTNQKPSLTGASKRKGQSIWSYQRKPKDTSEKETFASLDSGTLSLHNAELKAAENQDLLNAIPSILTPKPSPSKNESSTPSPIITKILQQKQQNRDNLRINESIRNELNITETQEHLEDLNIPESVNNDENMLETHQIPENVLELKETTESLGDEEDNTPAQCETIANDIAAESTRETEDVPNAIETTPEKSKIAVDKFNYSIFVDTSKIKIEQYEEEYNTDVSGDNSDEEYTASISHPKSEAIFSEENSRSSSRLSLKSTRSVKFNVKPSWVDDTRPRSDSFVNRNASSSFEAGNSFLKDNSQLQSFTRVKSHISEASTELVRPINQEENCKDWSKSKKSNSIISNNTESHDDNSDTLLQDNNDLFSNDVTFEMFCKKVAKVGKTGENSKKTEMNKISPRLLRKRRRLTTVEQSSKSNTVCLKSPHDAEDDDDDVIFVGETLNPNNRFDDSTVLENGFAGFSSEETCQDPYSIDLSNLSYNNPLKSKHKEGSNDTQRDTFELRDLPQRRTTKRKCKDQLIEHKSLSKHEKNEFSFILKAAPYMNQAKLLCIPCGLTFKTFHILLWHMSAHFSWFRFQCSKCSFITFNRYNCMLHARKQHKLKEINAANYILPLPNWKTVLMSHEFRLLKDCNDMKGKHTDEKIGIDESQDQYIEDNCEVLESDAILFGESSKSSEESTGIVIEKENLKRRNKSGKMIIDIQETIKDFQKLPEPVELAMPADVSEVIRTFSFDEGTLSPDETFISFDSFADDSNDDWGLPKEDDYGNKPTNSNGTTEIDSNNKNTAMNEKAVNVRPSRIRTKAKQNDDFVYYDNDVNNVLKSSEFFKGNPQKHRTDSVLPLKSKVSGKTVPTTLKKKI